MTATNHTEHYELSQYTESDRPTYTGDYNGDMFKIDAAIHAAAQSGGMTAVAHTDDLTGNGTMGSPLGIRPGTAINPVDNRWNSIDFNDYYTNGIYTFNGELTNGPRPEWTSGALMVLKSYQVIIQLFFSRWFGTRTPIAVRTADVDEERVGAPRAGTWSAWQYVNFIGNTADVSALTSRITALETQVAALTAASTPSDTGLATTQRDTQYSDDYNIVRAGTPTRRNESEETHHE